MEPRSAMLAAMAGGRLPGFERWKRRKGPLRRLERGTSFSSPVFPHPSKKAGFSKSPDTTDAFLEYAKAMKKNNTPGGFALGHASGDGNAWVYWALWAHGGNVVDKNDKVIINSPETEKALTYGKQLYENMILGTAAWNDASNYKAFLAGEINWTDNGISIYVAAKNHPSKIKIA